MKYNISWLRYVAALFLSALLLAASCEKDPVAPASDQNPFYRFMFYNVENLFDTINDPNTNDEQFTPEGEYKWSSQRYLTKLTRIGAVIRDLGGDTLPALIGLCEVENRQVLDDLLQHNNLDEVGYRIIHRESPDYRGIDVALLYRDPWFKPLTYRFYPVWFPFDTATRTREVLYVKGMLAGLDTLHLFINHWPSRSGGELASRPKRVFVAELIKSKIDSILRAVPESNVILTGDLNDEPFDLSIVSGLNALSNFNNPQSDQLYALTADVARASDVGSYKYRGNWNYLDQFIVSGGLLDTTRTIYCRPSDYVVYHPDYLEEDDKDYFGKRPFRMYLGPVYHNGYSDHFPVFLNLRYRNP